MITNYQVFQPSENGLNSTMNSISKEALEIVGTRVQKLLEEKHLHTFNDLIFDVMSKSKAIYYYFKWRNAWICELWKIIW